MATNGQVQCGEQEQTLEERLAAMERRVQTLEEENARKGARIAELEEQLGETQTDAQIALNTAFDNEEFLMGEWAHDTARKEILEPYAGVVDMLEDIEPTRLEELNQKIRDEVENRGTQDAKLRRIIGVLEEETGIEVTNSDIMGDDKIQRVLRHGPSDVTDRVFEVHNRAYDLLANITQWGVVTNDKMGPRVTISSPEARQRLKDKRGETLSTTEIKRVFEKVEEWGADSPRKAKADFSGRKNKLVLELGEAE